MFSVDTGLLGVASGDVLVSSSLSCITLGTWISARIFSIMANLLLLLFALLFALLLLMLLLFVIGLEEAAAAAAGIGYALALVNGTSRSLATATAIDVAVLMDGVAAAAAADSGVLVARLRPTMADLISLRKRRREPDGDGDFDCARPDMTFSRMSRTSRRSPLVSLLLGDDFGVACGCDTSLVLAAACARMTAAGGCSGGRTIGVVDTCSSGWVGFDSPSSCCCCCCCCCCCEEELEAT